MAKNKTTDEADVTLNGVDSGNGEVPKTRKPRVTMEMKGLGNITVDKDTKARIDKAAELAKLTVPELFAQHLRSDFHALLDGQLTRDGNTLPSLKERVAAARTAEIAGAEI